MNSVLVWLGIGSGGPAQILLEFDVGAEKLAQVDLGRVPPLLHRSLAAAAAVLQSPDLRRVIRSRIPNLKSKKKVKKKKKIKLKKKKI